ncbi:hypothetical protein KR093_006019, partial [Drosophila rubida]
MSIYDYLHQHFNTIASSSNNSNTTTTTSSQKRQRRHFDFYEELLQLPTPKVRKHNYSNYQRQQEQEQQQQQQQLPQQWHRSKWQRQEEEQQRKRKQHGTNSTMDNYDIRFFFYINSLILFTMSCRQYEGDDFKHFIVDHIREFDRVRRKARKRRKRKAKEPAAAAV